MQHYLLALLMAVIAGLIAGFLVRLASKEVRLAVPLAVFGVTWAVAAWVFRDDSTQAGPDNGEAVLASLNLERLRSVRPVQAEHAGYISSQSCQECHPQNHATWSASYHRRMTQVATPDAVLGNFDDVHVSANGRDYYLFRRGDTCWVRMDNHDLPPGRAPQIDVPIVMTTGSHHMQVYWFPTGRSRVLGQLPMVFLNETQSWIPRNAAFLVAPTEYHPETGRWNETCIGCHTTHGQPRPDGRGGWDSQVGEFGIACEACHGPAQEHVALRRDESGTLILTDRVVNPAQLSHRRGSQVCGQCHSVNVPLTMQGFLTSQQEGKPYRPGDDLDRTRMVVQETSSSRAHLAKAIPDVDQFMREQFWPDGMIRISGREFNGLSNTACFQKGTMSCLTCHQLHQDEDDPRPAAQWANDQLHLDMGGDRVCLECHDRVEYGSRHSRHTAESTGARCYNCHMPYTTYGLLKGIRSHHISSPSVANDDLKAGRPNACNLCHLDRTLDWTAEHLHEWHGGERPSLDQDQQTIAASLLYLLRGDAGQRAVTAWNMGWLPAMEASGADWQAPFLASLLEDPYDAVRMIAHRSLKQLPGFSRFDYDYVGSPKERGPAKQRAWQAWRRVSRPAPDRQHLLLDSEGDLNLSDLARLLKQRDERPMNLAE